MTERTPNPAGADLFRMPPEADAWDQIQPLADDVPADADRMRTPFDADPADAYEQRQLVPLDDDDYR